MYILNYSVNYSDVVANFWNGMQSIALTDELILVDLVDSTWKHSLESTRKQTLECTQKLGVHCTSWIFYVALCKFTQTYVDKINFHKRSAIHHFCQPPACTTAFTTPTTVRQTPQHIFRTHNYPMYPYIDLFLFLDIDFFHLTFDAGILVVRKLLAAPLWVSSIQSSRSRIVAD